MDLNFLVVPRLVMNWFTTLGGGSGKPEPSGLFTTGVVARGGAGGGLFTTGATTVLGGGLFLTTPDGLFAGLAALGGETGKRDISNLFST